MIILPTGHHFDGFQYIINYRWYLRRTVDSVGVAGGYADRPRRRRPDRFDLLGAGIALAGVFIIMWGRRWF